MIAGLPDRDLIWLTVVSIIGGIVGADLSRLRPGPHHQHHRRRGRRLGPGLGSASQAEK